MKNLCTYCLRCISRLSRSVMVDSRTIKYLVGISTHLALKWSRIYLLRRFCLSKHFHNAHVLCGVKSKTVQSLRRFSNPRPWILGVTITFSVICKFTDKEKHIKTVQFDTLSQDCSMPEEICPINSHNIPENYFQMVSIFCVFHFSSRKKDWGSYHLVSYILVWDRNSCLGKLSSVLYCWVQFAMGL